MTTASRFDTTAV